MRTMSNHPTMIMGLALLLGFCGTSTTVRGGDAVEAAVAPIEVVASRSTPESARSCPICNSRCCSGAGNS